MLQREGPKSPEGLEQEGQLRVIYLRSPLNRLDRRGH